MYCHCHCHNYGKDLGQREKGREKALGKNLLIKAISIQMWSAHSVITGCLQATLCVMVMHFIYINLNIGILTDAFLTLPCIIQSVIIVNTYQAMKTKFYKNMYLYFKNHAQYSILFAVCSHASGVSR